jgi:hypothetical protein
MFFFCYSFFLYLQYFCLNIFRRKKHEFRFFFFHMCSQEHNKWFLFFFFLDLGMYFMCILSICSNDNTNSFFFVEEHIHLCFYKSPFFRFSGVFLLLLIEYSMYCVIGFYKQASITCVYSKSEFAIPPSFFFFFCKHYALYSINAFESRNNRNDYYSVLFVLVEYMSMYVCIIHLSH